MASRSLADLKLGVRAKVEKWVAACKERGVDVLVYCTLRTPEEQEALYAQGRTKPGRIVTKAPAWRSWHNTGRAVDAVPLVHGKPDWSYSAKEPHWQVFAEEARAAGLEWAGDWTGDFVEYVHVQDDEGLTLSEAKGLELHAREGRA
jgi:peptidoglycan L-alanyl-D-glutamate endopeptidase CwlK